MNKEEILLNAINDYLLNINNKTIATLDSNIINDLGLDSLEVAELFLVVRACLEINLEPEEIFQKMDYELETVRDFLKCLQK